MPVEADATIRALDVLSARILEATRDTAGDGARFVQLEARAIAPVRLGTLRASIRIDGPRLASAISGLPKSVPTGPATFAAQVGPTVVYGRIRELGGPIPGRRTVMTHPFLKWYWQGKPVFRRKVQQRGVHFLEHSADALRPVYRSMAVRRFGDAIRSV